jgi:hypothetical protein
LKANKTRRGSQSQDQDKGKRGKGHDQDDGIFLEIWTYQAVVHETIASTQDVTGSITSSLETMY